MLDIAFDRVAPARSVQACKNRCKAAKAKAKDDQLSTATQKLIESHTGRPEPTTGKLPSDDSPSLLSADSSPCRKKALTLGPTLRRFNRYREALPYARAADDMNKLGDQPPAGLCLSRLHSHLLDRMNRIYRMQGKGYGVFILSILFILSRFSGLK